MTEARVEFHDGVTAESHAATLVITESDLITRAADQSLLAAWPWTQLRRVDHIAGVLRVTDATGAARLVLRDPKDIDEVLLRAPRLRPTTMFSRRNLAIGSGVGAIVIGVVMFAWFVLPGALDALARATPRSFEEALGRKVMAQAIGQDRICVGPEGQAAIDRLAQVLARSAPDLPRLAVLVINDPSVNAFAAPGGWIGVYRGLIDEARSADELAGVLAHEIGHVAERHQMRGVARALGLNFLATLIGAGTAVDVGSLVLQQSFSRDFEREADDRAARLLIDAGLTTAGLTSFFDQMARREADQKGIVSIVNANNYLRSHPHSNERREAARSRQQAGRPAMTNSEWAATRGMCATTVAAHEVLGIVLRDWSFEVEIKTKPGEEPKIEIRLPGEPRQK